MLFCETQVTWISLVHNAALLLLFHTPTDSKDRMSVFRMSRDVLIQLWHIVKLDWHLLARSSMLKKLFHTFNLSVKSLEKTLSFLAVRSVHEQFEIIFNPIALRMAKTSQFWPF